jgi:hypothetical protein
MTTTTPQSPYAPQPSRFDAAQVWTVVIAVLLAVIALTIGLSVGSSDTGTSDDVARLFESGSGVSISDLEQYSDYYGYDTCEWPGDC